MNAETCPGPFADGFVLSADIGPPAFSPRHCHHQLEYTKGRRAAQAWLAGVVPLIVLLTLADLGTYFFGAGAPSLLHGGPQEKDNCGDLLNAGEHWAFGISGLE